ESPSPPVLFRIFPDIQEQILNQGSMQLVVADLPGISQKLKLQFITFPNGDENSGSST
ncbi:hypothetical protein L9F63_021939, partial [Diploptera punctata]